MLRRDADPDRRRRALHLSPAGHRLHRAAIQHRTRLRAAAPLNGAPTRSRRCPPAVPIHARDPPRPAQELPVNIIVLGATGRTGRLLVPELTAPGHTLNRPGP